LVFAKVIPKGDWFCSDCKPPPLPPRPAGKGRKAESEKEEDSEEENESDDEGMPVLEEEETLVESCIVCGSGGEVICCDGCPGLYHLHCLDPPKQRVPRGLWYKNNSEIPRIEIKHVKTWFVFFCFA